MKILGIDTSCDDTCIALLEIRNLKLEILSNVVSSQVKLHAKYGGVYPALAKREHQRNLPIVFNKALRKAGFVNPKSKIQNPKIDLIAVTAGPGLEPCLWQGINFTQDLAEKLNKPLIPVNHIEAHILANFIEGFTKSISFPAICLVVSGGHTGLILMEKIGQYQLIGETRDDAAGECFDKVARILGLGYPGGPVIAEYAQKYTGSTRVSLPRPMINQKNYDFSFSGLKTAVLYIVKDQNSNVKCQNFVGAMCTEVQQAIIDVLLHKTLKAARDYKVKTIILGGGVAANNELRRQFKLKIKNERLKIQLLVPPKIFCTDNAAMVAVSAFFHQKEIKKGIKAEANFKI